MKRHKNIGEKLRKEYDKTDKDKKFKSKGLNYQVFELPATEVTYEKDDKGNYKVKKGVKNPKYNKDGNLSVPYRIKNTKISDTEKVYKADKIGPRYTDYHAESEGESDSEDPTIVYRGYNAQQKPDPNDRKGNFLEDPMGKGFRFDPRSKPDVSLKSELAKANGPKGHRIHSTRSRKVALRYAMPDDMAEALLNTDPRIDSSRIGKIAKIKLSDNDNYQDMSQIVPRREVYPTDLGMTPASLKSNQQVILNNEISPNQIMGIYDVSPLPPIPILSVQRQKEYYQEHPENFVRTRIHGLKNPALFHLSYTPNPNFVDALSSSSSSSSAVSANKRFKPSSLLSSAPSSSSSSFQDYPYLPTLSSMPSSSSLMNSGSPPILPMVTGPIPSNANNTWRLAHYPSSLSSSVPASTEFARRYPSSTVPYPTVEDDDSKSDDEYGLKSGGHVSDARYEHMRRRLQIQNALRELLFGGTFE